MNHENIYTHSERTVKKYTVYQAEQSARRRLDNKGHTGSMCVNATSGRSESEKITLEELNKIADRIYFDTLYHDGLL